jgi:hypothetical protein
MTWSDDQIAEFEEEVWLGGMAEAWSSRALWQVYAGRPGLLVQIQWGKNMKEPLPYLNQQRLQSGSWKRNYTILDRK